MANHTVGSILNWLNEQAPFETQEDFDNAGLQVGHPDQAVTSVLLALDLTSQVVKEAVQLQSQLIITHHPLLFAPPRILDLSSQVPSLIAQLIASNIALISAHTNIDQSGEYSASFALASQMGLQNIRREGKYVFLGDLPEPMMSGVLQQALEELLDAPVRQYGENHQAIRTLAIAGGAYSEGYSEAMQAGAQALLTGEVRHHHAVSAAAMGFLLYDGGHFATEAPLLPQIAIGLQKKLNTVQYSLQVHLSKCKPYRLQ